MLERFGAFPRRGPEIAAFENRGRPESIGSVHELRSGVSRSSFNTNPTVRPVWLSLTSRDRAGTTMGLTVSTSSSVCERFRALWHDLRCKLADLVKGVTCDSQSVLDRVTVLRTCDGLLRCRQKRGQAGGHPQDVSRNSRPPVTRQSPPPRQRSKMLTATRFSATKA